MNDTEMLDWLSEHILFPDEMIESAYLKPQIAILVPNEFGPHYDDNRKTLREAIQKARLKELHEA